MYIGSHTSISKGYSNAVKDAIEIGGNTLQFFSRNPRGSKAKKLDYSDIDKAKQLIAKNSFGPMIAHAPYILNLASNKDNNWNFAVTVLKDDLQRLKEIGAPFIIIHPGSHLGEGEEYGIKRIIKALDIVLSNDEKVMILLEGMAGVGTEIGHEFNHIKRIAENVKYPEKIGVCLDTCHLYCAGYDIKNNLEEVIEEFHEEIGLEKLKAFHLNDSKNGLGSRKDRHESIGEGEIGLEAFVKLINHPGLKNVPFLLETPGGMNNYKKEIKLLKDNLK